jgi:protein O-GlcNAc transferase
MGLLDRLHASAGGKVEPPSSDEAAAVRAITDGNALEDAGRPAEALRRYDDAVRLAPRLARAHLNRGNALLAMTDATGAADAFAHAIALDPQFAAAHFNLGNALVRTGRIEAAMVAYRRTLELKPDFADAEVALGVAQEELGRADDAIDSYRRALRINPRYAEVHVNLAHVLSRMGRLSEAEASYRHALEVRPDYVDALRGLGAVLPLQGRPEAAVDSYRRALAIDPHLPGVHNDLGNVQQQLGLLDDALASYRSALAIDPTFAEAHSNAGRVYLRRGQIREAIAYQRRALAVRPEFAEAHFNLGNALRDGGWPTDAIASYRRALSLRPDFAHGHVGLGDLLKDIGQLGEAQASFRRALEIDPALQDAHSSLLFCLSHDESVDPATLFTEHRRFGEHIEAPLRSAWPAHRNTREPERRLEVGFVSGDLRAHPVAYFVEPLLAHLAGMDGLSLHAYSNQVEDDAVTQRLRRHFRHWHPIAGLPDALVAERVQEDRIDILIDLSGHTSRNRLWTFARRPAPVQASWLGYPGTTGLAAIDYYFADAHFLPIAEFGGRFTEKLVHLPAVTPFLPEREAPPVSDLPALSNGFVTFGSFNRTSKLRPAVIALWSRLLCALPDARMVLGGMPQAGQYDAVISRFEHEGVTRERLELHARTDTMAYLQLHRRVDLCLDTFPYAGGTTTAHALWMGVPTLTLAGGTPAGRQGAAMLGPVGLQEFVALGADDYLRKGIALAADLPALAALRAQLRTRCEDSPHRKPEVIAAALDRALRVMWRRWCAGQPPRAFSTSGG